MGRMNPVETLKRQFEEIEEKLGYSFKNQELLLLSSIAPLSMNTKPSPPSTTNGSNSSAIRF